MLLNKFKIKTILSVIKVGEQVVYVGTFGRYRPQLRLMFIGWLINKCLSKLGKGKIDVNF